MNNNYNGYIIKFYRIINRESLCASDNLNFDYYCWGWFDGLRAIRVKKFQEYQSLSLRFTNSEEEEEIKAADQNCFRQKLLIYNTSETTEIDLLNNSQFNDLPLLSISIINLNGGNQSIHNLSEYLKKVKEDQFCSSCLVYNIFGVLSANNAVIVCRSNNYYDTKKFICSIRSFSLTNEIYTVFCTSNNLEELQNHWIEQNKLKVCFQLSTKPQFTPLEAESFVQKYLNEAKFEEILSIGKKDYVFSYEIPTNINFANEISDNENPNNEIVTNCNEHISKFVNFMFKDLYSKCPGSSSQILSSSTSFIYDTSLFKNLNFSIYESQSPSFDLQSNKDLYNAVSPTDCFSKWKDLIKKEIEGKLSENFVFELNRLILRAYQLLCEYQRVGIDSPDILEGVNGFLQLTKESANKIDRNKEDVKDPSYHLQSIILGLLSLNKLLDNREVNEFHDFEVPKSNIFFTGNSYKLIEFYSKFSRDIIGLLEDWSFEINGLAPKHNWFFLTTDGYSEVTVRRLFLNSEKNRLLNARVPTELLYTPYYTMCMLAHELGHFAKIGWDRKLRNRHFMLSIINAFFVNISANSDINIDYDLFLQSFF